MTIYNMKRNYSDNDVENAVKISHSYREVCRNLGICDHGGSPENIKKIIERLKLDISHFNKSWSRVKTSKTDSNIRKIELSEILVENSTWQSYKVKLKLLKEGIKEHKCEVCGNTEWNGQPIPLELHHINGNHYDNRLENLRLLCPNCHAQTDNYSKPKPKVESNKQKPTCSNCGKELYEITKSGLCRDCYNEQRKMKNCPSKEELLKKKQELKSYIKIGNFYNVSPNTVKRWFKIVELI